MASTTQSRSELVMLWAGVLTGPLMLAAEQALNFVLVPWACVNGAQWVLRVVDLVALVITAIAGFAAWQAWAKAGREDPGDSGGVPASDRFMALGGMGLSAMFFAAILSHGISTFLIGVCQ